MRRLRFYLKGLIPGIIIVFFILNQKGSTCSYLPNERVIAETLTKKFIFSTDFQKELKELNLDEVFIKDSILNNGKIDFNRSEPQRKPYPRYILFYPTRKPVYEIQYEKCKVHAYFIHLKKLK